MCILRLIRMLVVMPVVISPPQRAALDRGAAPEGEKELTEAGRAVRLMGEVAVVNARHCEHPDKIEGHGGPDCDRAHSNPDNGKAAEIGETDGFIKVLADEATGQILGASVLGPNASELVHMYIDAMNAHAPYTVIRDAVHIHPTLAEAIQSAVAAIG